MYIHTAQIYEFFLGSYRFLFQPPTIAPIALSFSAVSLHRIEANEYQGTEQIDSFDSQPDFLNRISFLESVFEVVKLQSNLCSDLQEKKNSFRRKDKIKPRFL